MTLVVVSVGTDHHPFDRLIEGVQGWLQGRPGARVVVQHGYSAPAAGAENHDFLPRERLLELVGAADLVVSQVGPGTILDANSVGRRPIAMPRDPSRGEHVDWHQWAFAEAMAQRNAIHLVHSGGELHAALAAAEADPRLTRMPPRASPADETAARLGMMTERLLSSPSQPIYWHRILPSLRRLPGRATPDLPRAARRGVGRDDSDRES